MEGLERRTLTLEVPAPLGTLLEQIYPGNPAPSPERDNRRSIEVITDQEGAVRIERAWAYSGLGA